MTPTCEHKLSTAQPSSHASGTPSATAPAPPPGRSASGQPALPAVDPAGGGGPARRFSFIAPRHPDGSDWPWLSQVGPMRRHSFRSIYISNTCERIPKATDLYIRWQYKRAMWAIRDSELAFIFSSDIVEGVTKWPSRWMHQPRRIYVGFTQDGPWPKRRIDGVREAMRHLDAITVFSEQERQLYIDRYEVEPARMHVIPIHTDEAPPGDYAQYPNQPPLAGEYVLSLGSPNRRFMPIARACKQLGVPLVIITRPWHKNDSLDELAAMGVTIITNADKMKSLTYLKHAKFTVMAFETGELPGAFTTLIHAMFLRTPSVVTSCLGMSNYVVSGENGIVTPHGDEDALREAIDRLWSEPGLATRMAEAGFARAQRLYSLQAAATAHEALAQHVLNQRA